MKTAVPWIVTVCLGWLGWVPSMARAHELTYDAKICTCLGDLHVDGVVDQLDIVVLLDHFHEVCPENDWCTYDLNHNHRIGESDIRMLLGHWGECLVPGDVTGDGVADEADSLAVLGALGRDCRTNLDLRGLVTENDFALAGDAWRGGEGQFPRIDVDGDEFQSILDLILVYEDVGVDCHLDINYSGTVDCDDYLDVCFFTGESCSPSDC